jgi:hypothetical protein
VANARHIFTATKRFIKVISSTTGQKVRSFGWTRHEQEITDFICDPFNEFRIITASSDRVLRVFDWTDGLLINVSQLDDI